MSLPTPDPAAALEASRKANEARAAVKVQLRAGTMTLAELFEQSDAEERAIVGHMRIRVALMSLPRIGRKKADLLLSELGMPPSRHVKAVGAQQRRFLIAEIYGL